MDLIRLRITQLEHEVSSNHEATSRLLEIIFNQFSLQQNTESPASTLGMITKTTKQRGKKVKWKLLPYRN
jgi:hypothetical protein